MTRVVQIEGAPGTGKTHTLKQKLREHVSDGLGLSGFYWLTFTNSGREDVEPELLELFPEEDAEDVTDRARTFHSVALSLCLRYEVIDPDTVGQAIISPDDARAVDHYIEFCDRHGMAFDADVTDTRKLLSGDRMTDKTGNIFFAINDYLTQTCKPPEKWRAAGLNIRMAPDAVTRTLEAWREYKHSAEDYPLFEHGDYITRAYEANLTPGVDVLLIDEFQDLAPVEYRLFKLWRDNGPIETAYIAGDPNQAIYSFRGGTPYYFEETDVNTRIALNESYRCRAAIAALANRILAANPDTDPRGFAGRESGGAARWRSVPDGQSLRQEIIGATDRYTDADPSVFLLTRTRYQQRELTRDLRRMGIPFELLGRRRGVWTGDFGRALEFLNNWQSGASGFQYQNAAPVLGSLPIGNEWEELRESQVGGFLDRETIEPFIGDYDSPVEAVDQLQITGWKRDILRNAVDAPAAIAPGEVRVGTIHAAKGLEAPTVFLFADSSETATRRYSRDPEHAAEEHRVYYVGATRAIEEVHLIHGYFSGPVAPPLKQAQVSEVAA